MKEECLKMYLNGMGFRGIERVKGLHHTTLITWVKQLGKTMVDAKSQDVHERELSGECTLPVGQLLTLCCNSVRNGVKGVDKQFCLSNTRD